MADEIEFDLGEHFIIEDWVVVMPSRNEPQPTVRVGSPLSENDEIPAFKLDLEEARDSEELHAIYRDLEFVIGSVRYLANLLQQRGAEQGQPISVGESSFIERSLYMAALIAYIRCFTSGKRQRLDESIFSGEAEYLLDMHNYYKETRDKHIAHSVNAFEINTGVVHIKDLQSDELEIVRAGTAHVIRTGDSLDEVQWLDKLATYLQTIVYGRLHTANQKLNKRVRSLTKDELRALKPLVIKPEMGLAAARTPRN